MTWGDEQKSQRSPDPMVIPTEGPMGTGHQLLGRPTPVLCPGRGTRDALRAARAGGPDPCARAAPTLRRPPSRLNRDPRPSPREPRPRTERGRRRVPEGTDALRVAAGACSGGARGSGGSAATKAPMSRRHRPAVKADAIHPRGGLSASSAAGLGRGSVLRPAAPGTHGASRTQPRPTRAQGTDEQEARLSLRHDGPTARPPRGFFAPLPAL